MLLLDYLDRYNRHREIATSTMEHYRWVVRSYLHHGGAVQLEDITGESVSDWLIRLRDAGRSPWTIKQRRISLLVIWRAAWEEGMAPPLEPVRRLRPLHYSPTAWTVEEIHQLIRTADADLVRPLFWGSLVRAGYDTGLRLGDLLGMTVGQVLGAMQIIQHKTGLPVSVQLRPETLVAIHQQIGTRQPTDPIWPLWARREAFYRSFRILVRTSGIRPGTFRWLRRSAATQLERVQPGTSTTLLGHCSRSTTERWYIDASQLTHPPLPPL